MGVFENACNSKWGRCISNVKGELVFIATRVDWSLLPEMVTNRIQRKEYGKLNSKKCDKKQI